VICRWYLNKKAVKQDSQKIILSGDNKLDVLHIELSDLICISSADNYIEIHFLKRGHLHKKLLRNTLKNIQQDVPSLIKVHRSHLINPDHFKEWKNKNVIALTHTEVPISKNYRQVILDLDQSSLKSND
jgi:DNA-binding LytR/AlgR family response regulator